MHYRSLGSAGVKVSQVCLGTMTFGGATNAADSIRIMHRACELGINFFDSANIYNAGESEKVVGQGIADRRSQIILATKGRSQMGTGPNESGASRKHLTHELHASLKRLGTDYIDVYYVHAPDYTTPIEETLRTLDDFVRSGKVLYIACSNYRAWRLCEALWTSDKLNLNKFVCLQPLYNILNRDIEVEVLPLCKEKGLGVVSYSPLARGVLTGKYQPGQQFPEGSRAARQDKRILQTELRDANLVAAQEIGDYCKQRGVSVSQFATAWCLANPILTSIILGPRTMEQFEDNMGCLNVTITPDDEKFVDSIVPPGEHCGKGFQDPAYPVTGRPRG